MSREDITEAREIIFYSFEAHDDNEQLGISIKYFYAVEYIFHSSTVSAEPVM